MQAYCHCHKQSLISSYFKIVIVDFGSSDVITINLLMSANVMKDRIWDIEVIMTPCRSVLKGKFALLKTQRQTLDSLAHTNCHQHIAELVISFYLQYAVPPFSTSPKWLLTVLHRSSWPSGII